MQERYYYVRDRERKPIITVCLLQNRNEEYGRGIAYCHIKDNPFKLRSRALARAKAIRALRTKTVRQGIIHDERTFNRILECFKARKWAPLKKKLGITNVKCCRNVGMIYMYENNYADLTRFEYNLFTWRCGCGALNDPPMKVCGTCGKKPPKPKKDGK